MPKVPARCAAAAAAADQRAALSAGWGPALMTSKCARWVCHWLSEQTSSPRRLLHGARSIARQHNRADFTAPWQNALADEPSSAASLATVVLMSALGSCCRACNAACKQGSRHGKAHPSHWDWRIAWRAVVAMLRSLGAAGRRETRLGGPLRLASLLQRLAAAVACRALSSCCWCAV